MSAQKLFRATTPVPRTCGEPEPDSGGNAPASPSYAASPAAADSRSTPDSAAHSVKPAAAGVPAVPSRSGNPFPIAVFASGSGSNFEAIAAACASGRLAARVALLVCDKPGAPVCARAARFGIETLVFDPHAYPSKAAYEDEIVQRLTAAGVRLICLAGYMRLVGEILLKAYGGRILNIHPSLLPAFKGAHAIRDAFDYGVKVFGVTIHLVDATLDGGPVVAQRAFAYEGRDMNDLERRIHALEHALYMETIANWIKEQDKG